MSAPLLAAGAIGFSGLVLLELRRADRRRLPGRIAASLAAIVALLALALEPDMSRRAADERAVLLTEGAAANTAVRLADSLQAGRILALGDSIADLAALRRRHPAVRELVLAGWGLPAEELARAGALRLIAATAPLPAGIGPVEWPSRIALGEEVPVRGAVRPAGTWVHLALPGHEPDSVVSGPDGAFDIRFTPRAAGLMTFALRAGASADTGAVDVRATPPPDVLILLGAPEFESTHLRRWLARRGGRVASRIVVSRGRRQTRAINGAPVPAALTPELLARFDVVLIDAAAAGTLPAAERDALHDAVVEEGLGVLALDPGLRALGLPQPSTQRATGARALRVRFPAGRTLSPPVIVEPIALAGDAGAGIILEAADGGALASWQAAGAGRVGLSRVRNPSRWLLEGDAAAYDRYWTTILASLGRPRREWRGPSPLPALAGKPIELAWPGRLDSVLVAGPLGTDTVYLAPDADSLEWSGRLIPRAPGAYAASGPADTLRFRVAAPESWRAARAAAAANATALHVALQADGGGVAEASLVSVPIPPWIFVGLFGATAGWLWWERRRSAAWTEKDGRTGVE